MSQELYKNYVKILSSVEIQNKLFVGENIGIGTLNPTEKLDVVGNTKISGDLHVNSNAHVLSSLTVDKDVTVLGKLSALGTSYFANTVFSTTSAICAYNTGPGPALYVYQAAGPYDVASFYDGDGVEVLHVGNATPSGNGKVGINNGDPNYELSVKGSISATELAYFDGDVKIGIEGQRISNLNVTGTISSANTLYVGGSLIQKDLQDVYSTVQSYSGLSWNQNLTFDENTDVIAIRDSNNISLSSITRNNKNYTHANFLPLSGGVVVGDLTITGNVSSLGTLTYIDSQVSITSAIEITNTGTGPALKVTQTGSQDIASFYDDTNSVLIIKDGGNIGVGTLNPNKKLTVIGEISSTGAAYIDGDLIQPEFVDLKSKVNSLSSNWNDVYTSVNTTSADWNSVYTNVNTNSASYATISYSNNAFLPLSGGNITGTLSSTANIFSREFAYNSTERPDLTGVKQALDVLLYTSPLINSLTVSGGNSLEVGQTLTTPTITWVPNKTLNSYVLTLPNGSQFSGSSTFLTYSDTNSYTVTSQTSSRIWSVAGTDWKSANASRSTTVSWSYRIYAGGLSTITPNSSDILTAGTTNSLGSSRTTLGSRSYTLNDQYWFVAYPSSLGTTSSLKVNGLNFTDLAPVYTINPFTNASGGTGSYYVYRTNNKLTGTYTMEVV